jgi:hypothetical protein
VGRDTERYTPRPRRRRARLWAILSPYTILEDHAS